MRCSQAGGFTFSGCYTYSARTVCRFITRLRRGTWTAEELEWLLKHDPGLPGLIKWIIAEKLKGLATEAPAPAEPREGDMPTAPPNLAEPVDVKETIATRAGRANPGQNSAQG